MGRDLYINAQEVGDCQGTSWSRRNDQISALPGSFGFRFILLHLLRLVINLLLSTMNREQVIGTCTEIVDQEITVDRDRDQTVETIHLLGYLADEKIVDDNQLELSYA